MPIFYPDNVQRGDRLQQLVDDVTSTQTNIKDQADQNDMTYNLTSQALNQLLIKQGVPDFQSLINKVQATMTPEQRDEYQQMIDFNKQFGDITDDIFQVSSLLFCITAGARITISVVNFARSVAAMRVIKQYTAAFKVLLTDGFSAGIEALKAAKIGGDIVEGAEVGAGVSRVTSILRVISRFTEALLIIGAAIDALVLIMQAIEGAEQKPKLIDAIHQTQIMRLSAKYFYKESVAITSQLSSMENYMTELAKYGPNNPVIVDLGANIALNVQNYQSQTSLIEVEQELEVSDANRGSYRSDDLSSTDVVAGALADIPTAGSAFPAGTYIIKNIGMSTVLDLYGGNTAVGTPINGYHANGGPNQQWILNPTGGATYTIQSHMLNTVYASHVQTIKSTPATLQVNSQPEDWFFDVSTTKGLYYIYTTSQEDAFKNLLLDLSSSNDATQVTLSSIASPAAQKQIWTVTPLGNILAGKYIIVNAATGTVLDLYGGNFAEGDSNQWIPFQRWTQSAVEPGLHRPTRCLTNGSSKPQPTSPVLISSTLRLQILHLRTLCWTWLIPRLLTEHRSSSTTSTILSPRTSNGPWSLLERRRECQQRTQRSMPFFFFPFCNA